jgi:hypothetical protein
MNYSINVKLTGCAARIVQKRSFGRKPEGKRPVGRSRRKWNDNIKLDFRELCWVS